PAWRRSPRVSGSRPGPAILSEPAGATRPPGGAGGGLYARREMLDSPATRDGRAEANRTLVLLAAAAAATGLAAALILTGHRVPAGVAALFGGAAMVAGGLAVRAGHAPRVAFADLMLDRLFDAAVLAPLAWKVRSAAPTVTAL